MMDKARKCHTFAFPAHTGIPEFRSPNAPSRCGSSARAGYWYIQVDWGSAIPNHPPCNARVCARRLAYSPSVTVTGFQVVPPSVVHHSGP
jgi:hypothetical protein